MGVGFRSRRWLTLAVVVALVVGAVSWLALRADPRHISDARTMSSSPPPPGGYFRLVPAGRWRTLPSYDVCEGRVHYSTWEPRPDNYKRNYAISDPAVVHRALEARPRAVGGAYDPRWDSWLVPRIDGQFAGTTDEIFQWAACKWGLPDDLLRAIAVRESTWYQYETYPAGRCVNHFGCGDVFTTASPTSRVFCRALARYGYDYQRDYGPGKCPKTFSIIGIKSWQDPVQAAWPDAQNGTFPFNRDSTAFAVDYLAGQLRGCFEGWQLWLRKTTGRRYAAGDLLGCVGSWYSGEWHSPAADGYIARVRATMRLWPWLDPSWGDDRPGYSVVYGHPGPDPLSPRNSR